MDDRRGFLRGATVGAVGFAAGVAADAAMFSPYSAAADRAQQQGTSYVVSPAKVPQQVTTRLSASTAGVVNVKDLGAKGDGRTDDSAAFAKAVAQAARSSRLLPFDLSPDPVGSLVIDVPPGTYVITQPGAMLGAEGVPSKINGLHWRGAGAALTTIVFKPSSPSPMLQNDRWQSLQLDGLSFVSDTPGSTFLLSKTTHNAQRYFFLNCSWTSFKYGVSLQGDNNNSEFVFVACHTTAIESSGAFFFIGSQNTSDQFLNYWFYGCTHWSTNAPFIDAARGGQFQVYGLDVSDFGRANGGASWLFRLRGFTHGLGVCQLTATGVRVEAKTKNVGLLRSDWPIGQVTLRNVDWSSQADSVTYGDIIRISYANTDGAMYTFGESTLAGGVAVAYSINDWAHSHRILFENCDWLQRDSPTDVVRYTGPKDANGAAQPPVRFVGCRGGSANPLTDRGADVWDATVGYRGQLVQSLQPRVLSLRGPNGVPSTGKMVANLPVGAIVTGFEVIGPAGAVTSGAKPQWTLAASGGGGTALGTVVASRAASAGYHETVEVDPPFLCKQGSERLTVTSSRGDQDNTGALVLIHGYW